jgi:ATP-dependent RNA helicase SUPV3L1/SUV3
VSTKVLALQRAWEHWCVALSKKRVTRLQPDEYTLHHMTLQEVEDTCRLYSAYAWLGYRLPEHFPDIELALDLSRAASERVDSMLQDQNTSSRRRHHRRR